MHTVELNLNDMVLVSVRVNKLVVIKLVVIKLPLLLLLESYKRKVGLGHHVPPSLFVRVVICFHGSAGLVESVLCEERKLTSRGVKPHLSCARSQSTWEQALAEARHR
jgi:hypothetical protein